jgi:predicted RNA-binding Zn-ribbon protein involved in translation (DUF1610 family)
MAASYTATFTCNKCGGQVTITNAKDVAAKVEGNTDYQCPRCGEMMRFRPSSIALTHSAGLIGGETTITHTIVKGVISSAAA